MANISLSRAIPTSHSHTSAGGPHSPRSQNRLLFSCQSGSGTSARRGWSEWQKAGRDGETALQHGLFKHVQLVIKGCTICVDFQIFCHLSAPLWRDPESHPRPCKAHSQILALAEPPISPLYSAPFQTTCKREQLFAAIKR